MTNVPLQQAMLLMGEAVHVWVQRVYGESILPTKLFCDSKTIKNKSTFEKKKRRQHLCSIIEFLKCLKLLTVLNKH